MIEKNDKEKKALAIVAGPYRLLQTLWFTELYKDYEWSVVLLRYGEDLEILKKMEKDCKRSGRFKKIYTVVTVSRFSSFFEKIKEITEMIFFYFIGRKKYFCKCLIEKNIGSFDYDLLCLASSYSIFEGAILNFAKEIPTIIMQEGMADYIEPSVEYNKIYTIAGKLLQKMEYVNFLCQKSYNPYKYCIKYATIPSKILDVNFKEIRQLFDSTYVNKEIFSNILKKTYDIKTDIKKYDLILFSSVTQSKVPNEDIKNLRKWLNLHCKNKKILIKKHPQDTCNYTWEELDIEINFTNIPGEVLLQLLDTKQILFAFPSSILLEVVGSGRFLYDVIFYKNSMRKEYYDNFKDCVDFLNISQKHILDI